MEEGEAHGLLQFCIAFQLDIGARPEVVQVGALAGEQPVPTGVLRFGQGSRDLIAERRARAAARPAVGYELDQAESLPGLHVRRDRHPPQVLAALRRVRFGVGRAFDDVIHASGYPQLAPLGRVHEHDLGVAVGELLGAQRRHQARRGPGIVRQGWHRLVGYEL